MAVDLRKAKEGNEVTFRCGGTAFIESITINDDTADIEFENDNQGEWTYDNLGGSYCEDDFSILDIVSIKAGKVNWKKLPPKAAFAHSGFGIIHYVGPAAFGPTNDLKVFQKQPTKRGDRGELFICRAEDVERSEEHDA